MDLILFHHGEFMGYSWPMNGISVHGWGIELVYHGQAI